MKYDFKEYSKWIALVAAVISMVVVIFLKSWAVFYDDLLPGTLLLIGIISAALAFLFGIIALPRWQSFAALAVFAYVAYCILFTPLYGIH